MNRIVLIGNGFDLAHNLPTRYEDFINWYWNEVVCSLVSNYTDTYSDKLCTLKIKQSTWSQYAFNNWNLLCLCSDEYIRNIISDKDNFEVKLSPFLQNICQSIANKKWVDIENEYYHLLNECVFFTASFGYKELNEQLSFIQKKLVEYLTQIKFYDINETIINTDIKNKIYSPIEPRDIAVQDKMALEKHFRYWIQTNEEKWGFKFYQYAIKDNRKSAIIEFIKKYLHTFPENDLLIDLKDYPKEFLLPDNIMLLSFNYTNTANYYWIKNEGFSINYIHGKLSHPDSIIFGYGDEIDSHFQQLLEQNKNDILDNIKSIKYLESENYRNVLSFMESGPYQIFVMGHSCGNSDRTLLNTLFEHKNCVSIKPFYYVKEDGSDNYLEIIKNISRNFTDMKLMRDRVVNKIYCEPM
jgi:hypothetical protein